MSTMPFGSNTSTGPETELSVCCVSVQVISAWVPCTLRLPDHVPVTSIGGGEGPLGDVLLLLHAEVSSKPSSTRALERIEKKRLQIEDFRL